MSGIKDGRVGEREKVTSNERRKKEREDGERDRERERGREGEEGEEGVIIMFQVMFVRLFLCEFRILHQRSAKAISENLRKRKKQRNR
jgi:hypothetical protein